MEWNQEEIVETIMAAPGPDDKWAFSGAPSRLWRFIFSEEWANHMYDEYPAYFWQDVLDKLAKRDAVAQITVDMHYDHGEAEESDVRQYMLDNKDRGRNFLIMPRTEKTTMACAWLRKFVISDVVGL